MATIAWIDLAEAAAQAGWPSGTPHATIVAIAQPESGRNPDAANRTVYAPDPLASWSEAEAKAKRDPDTGLYWVAGDPNGGSFGLTQINGVHDPAATGVYPFRKPTQEWIQKMFVPGENLRAAKQVWESAGRSFLPWGTFKFGLHEPFMAIAKVALDGRARITKLQGQLDVLADIRIALEGQVTRLSSELASAREYAAQLETNASASSQQLAAANTKVAELEARIAAVRSHAQAILET